MPRLCTKNRFYDLKSNDFLLVELKDDLRRMVIGEFHTLEDNDELLILKLKCYAIMEPERWRETLIPLIISRDDYKDEDLETIDSQNIANIYIGRDNILEAIGGKWGGKGNIYKVLLDRIQ